MEFRKNLLLVLMQCISESSTSNENKPLERLNDNDTLIQLIDINDNIIVYTSERFIEIYDTYGLDGFVF